MHPCHFVHLCAMMIGIRNAWYIMYGVTYWVVRMYCIPCSRWVWECITYYVVWNAHCVRSI